MMIATGTPGLQSTIRSNESPSAPQDLTPDPAGTRTPRFPFPPPAGHPVPKGWLGAGSPVTGSGGQSDEYDLDDLDEELQATVEARQADIRKGKVLKLLEEMAEAEPGAGDSGIDWSLESVESDLRDLSAAGRHRSRRDLAGLINDVLSETASAMGLVVLRGHRVLKRRLALQDQAVKQAPNLWLSAEVRDTLLPALIDMTLQLAELQRLMAATKRQNELTESRRQQNKKPDSRTASFPRRSATGTPRKLSIRKR